MWVGVAVGLLLFALVAFFLVPGYAREGTYAAITRLGAFNRGILIWRDRVLDKNGDVVTGKTWRPFGGLFFTIRFFERVHKYNFRRSGVRLVQGKIEVESKPEEVINFILVRPDVYPTTVEKAETLAISKQGEAPERIAVTAIFLVTIRIMNPWKALFNAPPNWLENTLARLNTLFKAWIGTKTLDQLITYKSTSVLTTGAGNPLLWDELKNDKLKEFLLAEWGVEIVENGIDLGDVTPPPEIQQALAAQKQQELEAKGRMASTAGLVLEIMATGRGKTIEEIRALITTDPDVEKEFRERAIDLVVREMGIKGRSYVDIRTPNGSSLEGLIALLAGRLPLGVVGRSEREGSEKEAPVKKKRKVKMGGETIEVEEEEE